MPSSKKRKWKISTTIISLLSVGGAVAINNLWLNPNMSFGGSAAGSTTEKTATGDAIQYQYGTIQLEVTVANGKITNINELQATASQNWMAAIPIIKQAALDAGSADFGNVSGATAVTTAYKEALSSALSKLG